MATPGRHETLTEFPCSWCDLPHVVYITIPTEKTMAACAIHAMNVADLAFLRAIELGLIHE